MIQRRAETFLPTSHGDFNMIAYDGPHEWMPHIAMVSGTIDPTKPVIVRIHSECLTGDLFSSKRCECGEQMNNALHTISRKGGVLIYLRQEGRGIGLINKMKAYQIQDTGVNTVDANMRLGLKVDARKYDIAIQILQELGVKEIHLLTNNPLKVRAFENTMIKVKSRLPLVISPNSVNKDYLTVKQELMGHQLGL